MEKSVFSRFVELESRHYPKEHVLHRISDYLESKAAVVSYDEWLTPEFDICYNALYEDAVESPADADGTLDIERVHEEVLASVNAKTEEQMVCAACGAVLREGEHVLCGKCIEKFETHQCACCGRHIRLSYYDKYVHGDAVPNLCDRCETVKCSECGEVFSMQKKKRSDLMEKGKKILCDNCQVKYREIVYRRKCANANCDEEIFLTYAAVKKIQENGKKMPTICEKCKRRGSELVTVGVCRVCGKEITARRYQFEQHPDSVNTKMHGECSKKIYLPGRICDTCGRPFSISYGEKSFYDSMNYELPKNCEACRKRR